MQRQERLERLVRETQQVLSEETERLCREALGRVDMSVLLRGFGPALEGLLAGAGGWNPYRVLGLGPLAPDEVVRLVYRHLAQRCHPDHGGSQEAMARLNRAYEEIARQRGWK